MKSLRARVNSCFDRRSVAAISLLWASISGKATPDAAQIPEPGILPLPGAGIIALFILRCRK